MLQVLEKNDYSLSVDWCFKTLMAYLNPFSHYSSFFFKKMVIYGSPVSYKIAVESVTFAVRETNVSRHNGGTSGAPLKPPETIVLSACDHLRLDRRLKTKAAALCPDQVGVLLVLCEGVQGGRGFVPQLVDEGQRQAKLVLQLQADPGAEKAVAGEHAKEGGGLLPGVLRGVFVAEQVQQVHHTACRCRV